MKTKRFFMPMHLQFFAEDPTPPADPADPGKVDEDLGDDGKPPKSEDQKPDDKKYSDADLDKIINQKFAKWQADSDEKLRQSQLSAEEKEQERIKKLEELEQTVAQRDAIDKSRKMLSEAKLPESFAKFVYDTKDDQAQEKFTEFQQALQAYRESIVNEIMKDKTPPKPKESQNDGKSWRDRARQNYQKGKESE
ncbi:capsid assembly scaffolding protein Gp46 family protein [Enterococcus casseliflavus]|uniref:capsid assembly scaffolding protein Gp46 family protein n=1 Tax=Enterococcus casseliflavus TaxID=37734 RepID=UPI0035CC09AD